MARRPLSPSRDAERIKNNLVIVGLVTGLDETPHIAGEPPVFRHLAGSIAFAVAAVICAAPAFATEFLVAIEDVPLVDGMVEQPEPLVFESDQGRVVRTSAQGKVGTSEIAAFYIASLPQLGWRRVEAANTLSFERENERLNISMREPASAAPITVSFELIVKLASTRLPE